MNNMNFNLPFYGKKGTIKKIEEDKDYYIVYRYGLNGKEETIFRIKKNKNNFKALYNNFYDDLYEYLNKAEEEYEKSKRNKLKQKYNKNNIKGLFIISSILAITSIPLLNTHESLGYLGIILDTIAIPTTLVALNMTKKNIEDDKKIRFIKNYEQQKHRYETNKEDKPKNITKTTYKGISDNKENHINDLRKLLIKKPENNSN